jgi:hypothetical protein
LLEKAQAIQKSEQTSEEMMSKGNRMMAKRVEALQKMCQMMVQETVQCMEERYQMQAKEREEMVRVSANIDST